jgi:sugar-specific transcriptional regulator TrmB
MPKKPLTESKREQFSHKMRFSEVLEKAGLEEKEAVVYETLLKNGRLGAGEILKKVPYRRGDLYNILYSLRDKGIIEQTIISNRLHFSALEPHKIKTFVAAEELRYRQADTLLDSILPGLSELYKLNTARPIVRVYEGFEGIKEIYNDTLIEKKPILAFSEAKESDPQVWRWLRDYYVKRRVKGKIPARVIVAADKTDKKAEEYLADDKAELRQTRVVDKKLFPCRLEIQIYADKISFANYNKDDALIGIIIDNALIAESMRGLFELAWDRSARK